MEGVMAPAERLSETTRRFYFQAISGTRVLTDADLEGVDAAIASARADGIGPERPTDLYLLWTLPRAARGGGRLLDGRDQQIAELLEGSEHGSLLAHPIGALKSHGQVLDKYVLAARDLGLDHKQVAVCIGARHYILNSGDFSQQEVTRVFQSIIDDGTHKWLRLASMKLKEVPPGLLDVRGIEKLDLSRNPIQELPERLFELADLKELRLEKTKLRSLPAGIGRLSRLQFLTLNESKVKTVAPEIGSLANLRDLRLVETRLEDLPDELANVSGLECLLITLTPLSRNKARVAELRGLGLPL